MEKLNFQDAFFLRAESPSCPFHVAGLMIFTPPEAAPANYFRRLAATLGQLNGLWPVFSKKLHDPDATRTFAWVEATDFDGRDHVYHYSLPQPGRMSDLLRLVSRAYEGPLDRTRPLWEVHLIEGLPGGQFALYVMVHHALVDGVGGLRMIDELLDRSPRGNVPTSPVQREARPNKDRPGLTQTLGDSLDALLKQAAAIPEVSGLLASMGRDTLSGRKDTPQLPFSAPHSIINSELDARRGIVTCDFPLGRLRAIGARFDGTINDALIAICGGALRQYLLTQNALPKKSLDAGVPVSIKADSAQDGNQLGYILCPLGTDISDPAKRMARIVRTTRKAKRDLDHVSPTANADFANLMFMPYLVLTLTGQTQRLPPPYNITVSNVPGPAGVQYLEGARLNKIYPLNIITDGMGLSATAISYNSKLFVSVITCPSRQPGIGSLDKYMKANYEALRDALPRA